MSMEGVPTIDISHHISLSEGSPHGWLSYSKSAKDAAPHSGLVSDRLHFGSGPWQRGKARDVGGVEWTVQVIRFSPPQKKDTVEPGPHFVSLTEN